MVCQKKRDVALERGGNARETTNYVRSSYVGYDTSHARQYERRIRYLTLSAFKRAASPTIRSCLNAEDPSRLHDNPEDKPCVAATGCK